MLSVDCIIGRNVSTCISASNSIKIANDIVWISEWPSSKCAGKAKTIMTKGSGSN